MKVYIMTSKDKASLPVAMEYSVQELAEATGHATDTIFSVLSKYKSGMIKNPRFEVIDLGETNDAVEEFYKAWEPMRKRWRARLHTRRKMDEVLLEVYQKDKLQFREIGETEEETYGKALMDLQMWEERKIRERNETLKKADSGADGS